MDIFSYLIIDVAFFILMWSWLIQFMLHTDTFRKLSKLEVRVGMSGVQENKS